ncbi:MAG: intermembrane phospholipid transport protein YdbH family protein [Rhodospirillaceae bacterium]
MEVTTHPDMLPPSRIKTLLGLAEDATDRLALQVADQPITLQTTLDRDTLALSPVMLSGALAIREDQTDAPSLLSLRLDEARFDPATVTVSIPDAEVSASRLAPVPGITLDRPVLHLLEGAWSPENPITGSLTLRSGLDIAPDSLADPLTLTGGQVSAQASVALDPLAQTGTVDLSALSITADEVTLSPVRLDSPTLTLSAEATRSAQALEIAKPMVQLTAAGGSLADSPLDPLDLKLAIEGSDAPIIVALKRDNATAPLVTLPEGLTLTSPRVEPLRLLSESGAVQAEAQDPVLTLAGPWPPSAEAPLVAQFSAPSLIAAGTRIETPALTARLADPALGPAVTLTGLLPRLPGEPARLPAATRSSRPLSLSASLEALEEPEAERHRLRGSLSSGNGAIRADLLGRLGRDLQTLDLSFLLKPVVFAPGGRQLGVLYGGPELDGLVQGDLTGSVAAKGQFRLRPPRSKGSPLRQSLTVDLLLEDVSGQIADLDITQINGVVRLTGFDPLRSPVQELAIAEIDAGIPLTGVLVNYQFDGRGNLLVDRASLSLAGGMIATEGLTVPLRSGAPLDIPLSVSGLQLADLARLTELDGLQATGTLSGEIPLQLREDELFIDFATLTSDSPGTLIYIPPADPETIAAGNEGVKLLLLAVDDFHYESLILTIDGSPDGEVEVDLGIAGANPALYDGYPIELNLSVTGAVMELVRKNIRTYTLPGRIQDAMDGFFQ